MKIRRATPATGTAGLAGRLMALTVVLACVPVWPAADAWAQDVKRGGSIAVAASSTPSSLLSQVDTSTNAVGLSAKYLETLVKVDDKGEFRPVLATAWKASPDGLTWTFTLRQGVKWHDGKPFVAEDVTWNLENVWRKVWSIQVMDAIVSATAAGDTVTLQLSTPISPEVFLVFFATRAHVLAPHGFAGTTLQNSPQNQMPTGTGPFKVTEHVKGQYVIMARNPDYWDKGLPYLDKIVWRFIDDQNTRTAALHAGELDLVPMSALPLAEIEAAKKNPKFAVSSKGYEDFVWYTGLVFNMLSPHLQKETVRQAIAHAIDKRRIVDLAFLGQAAPQEGAFPSGVKHFNADVPRYEFSPAKANRLLDEAGFPRGRDGQRFSLKLLSPPYLQGVMQRSGQYIVQALKDVGIGVTVEVPDLATYLRRVYRERDFDLDLYNAAFMLDACISTVQWYTTAAFKSGGYFRNHSGLQDPKVDAAADRGCTALDPKDRAQSLSEFQRLTNASMSVLNLAQEDRVNVYRVQLKNVGANSPIWYYSAWADLWLDR